MSKWVIGKYIRLSQADQDLMKKENKSESESISHQKALIQNFINDSVELKDSMQYEFLMMVILALISRGLPLSDCWRK